ncbi:GNAT family N-acetyltransferase [Pseudanabaena sp. FACHB-2040]|uniref:GNAT family N-acetyltransferase n=1 Tax=Pseudanabaena sp. FACHB-2040 TaxID=2692859 RepID=UPI00168A04CB|nr:GNAT family N-acetyltransferase [Pseudanabaena sp. FACHB-2040]MBD2260963.1 GNAT family N-acetyltransferase [Pseudanabaena sp. FACHB-2040]
MIFVEIVDYQAEKEVIHSIRYDVFVQEQQVPADIEIDRWDPLSIHVLARQAGQAVGTGRLLPDGHIGRVAVRRPWRHQGIGRLLMEQLLQTAREEGHPQVVLSAQCHAINFYQKLGFQEEGKVYLEAGIKHIKMVKPLRVPAKLTYVAQPPETCSAQWRNRILAATYNGA